MRILYLGSNSASSTSSHRANALRRLGHEVAVAEPAVALSAALSGRLRATLHYRTGYRLLQAAALQWIDGLVAHYRAAPPALVWVDSGELLGLEVLRRIRSLGCPIVLYNVDDPTGGRDGRRFDSLITAIPEYDLCVTVREVSALELKQAGARAVLKVWRSYDEVAHAPFDSGSSIPSRFHSDVVFVGTWMRHEHRDAFLLNLAALGVPISIWGNGWHKSRHWRQIQRLWRGPAVYQRDYVAAIQGAKIAIGLLSKGNRDLHTQRSVETTYCGGLFCAEKTSEHLQLYENGVEALLWSDLRECAEQCLMLLADDEKRAQVRDQGGRRIRAQRVGNENVLAQVLTAVPGLMKHAH